MIDPLIIPIVAVTGLFTSITVGLIAHYAYLVQRISAESSLKHEMVIRGFSAEQIALVLGTRANTSRSTGCFSVEKPHKKAA